MKPFYIHDREINTGQPAYIIAEISANHLGDKERTLRLIRSAAETGADAIKIQTLTADSLTIDCDEPHFIIQDECPWKGQRLYDLYSETPLPYEWHQEIFDLCAELEIDCFSTPYDKSSLEFLAQFNPPAYKIASFEIVDIPLVRAVAKKQKPIIFSTGIATKEDIDNALKVCKEEGNEQIAILKCTSGYPAPLEDLNLAMIPKFVEDYGIVSGLSDHTLGTLVPTVARSLGALIIEKHITHKRSDGGPDASFSLEVEEFAEMVQAVRNTEAAMGVASYELTNSSSKGRNLSKSIFIVEDVQTGDVLTEDNMNVIRPGFGLLPIHFEDLIGKTVTKDLKRGTPLNWSHLEK